MFGYVRPYKDEMKVREYEQYKGIYCGLCRALGKEYGIFTRLTLSYDCTFFAAAATVGCRNVRILSAGAVWSTRPRSAGSAHREPKTSISMPRRSPYCSPGIS